MRGVRARSIPNLPLLLLLGSMVLAFAFLGRSPLSLASQPETRSVTVESLASTKVLPTSDEPLSASLERIAIAPGGRLEFEFPGPVLLYVEQGTLNVDYDRYRLVIVQTGDQKAIHGEGSVRDGNVPTGYGVYSEDGVTGPLVNSGQETLRLLAVLLVPQRLDANDTPVINEGSVAAAASPIP